MDKLRIFVVEDHLVVRAGLKMLINLQPDMEVIGEAADGKDALNQILTYKPDIILLDVSLPEMSGEQMTSKLMQVWPVAKVLVLTVHEDRGNVQALLKAGARGYMLKRAAAEELIDAIHHVAEGDTYLDPALAGEMFKELSQKGNEIEEVQRSSLSERETEVLQLIAHGFSNKEIAGKLNISVKTVETYKSRGMEKLNLRSRAEIVRHAIRQGWLSENRDVV